nr:FixH family protein [Neobacillus sp. Marseille-Q6967]
MKKVMMLTALLLLIIISGCSAGPDYKVEITKAIYYQENSSFEIKVTDSEEAVEDLKVTAAFSMTNMDHGTTDVELSGGAEGKYTGEVSLPMAGKYEVVFTLDKDGKKTEEVMEYEVVEPEGVASINGKWITNEDLEFYKLINQLQLAINRETDEKRYTGKELEEALTYWDSQEKLLDDQNQLLTQIIRLRAMAILAEEKGHKVSDMKIAAEMEKVRGQYAQFESAKKMIAEYGEDKFWEIEEKQFKLIVLSQKVQKDLVDKVKKENPTMGEQEVYFQAQKQYEELLVSQMNSLEIEIL